jgi:hypothetical protein
VLLPNLGDFFKGFATTAYTLIGIVGYLMFGDDVENEVRN